MKKVLIVLLTLVMIISIAACSTAPEAPEKDAEEVSEVAEEVIEDADAPATEKMYFAVVSKGFQHKFWQTVLSGAEAAAADYGVEMTFDGPPSESDINIQVDMVNAVLAKNPDALCLAALDTESLNEQLNTCIEKGIPVIGFDSGVPNAPDGAIISTASTDNAAAGAIAAEKMFEAAYVNAAITAATVDAPIVISVISQDATSASITGRTDGFVDKLFELCDAAQSGLVAVTGHDTWSKASSSGDVAVEIVVSIAATTSVADCQTAAQAILQKDPVGIFCTNSGSVDGMLAATTDGSELDRETGKYSDMIVIGFDSGATLLNAITNEWFYGAITQDPYMIGYLAIELAAKAINGEAIDDLVDTGAKFYDTSNMDDPDIAALLYE